MVEAFEGFNFSTSVKTRPFSLGKDFGTFILTLPSLIATVRSIILQLE